MPHVITIRKSEQKNYSKKNCKWGGGGGGGGGGGKGKRANPSLHHKVDAYVRLGEEPDPK